MEYFSNYDRLVLDEGRIEGAAMVLAGQLTQRFGPLSQTTQRKLAKANLEQLNIWSKAILDAQSLKQVFSATKLSKTH